MNEKSLACDFLVKGNNLKGFLKDEALLSPRLFDAIAEFCEAVVSMKNTSLSKAEIASVKKSASLASDKIELYLSSLVSIGLISIAQNDSMLKTLDVIKKEINI